MDLRAELYLRRRKSGNPNPGGMLRWIETVCRNLLMRFCPQCGAPLMAGAKFCVECGRQLGDSASLPAGAAAASSKPPKPASKSAAQLSTAFIVVFVGITVLGLAVAVEILMRP